MASPPRIPAPRPAPVEATGDPVTDAIAIFSRRVAEKLGRGGQNEDQLRGPTEELFRDLGRGLGLDVIPYGEVRLPEFGVRPDYAIDLGRDRIGYIELKAPGMGVPPDWQQDRERNQRQHERMRDLPNLLYSDGSKWRLFRPDEPPGSAIQLVGNIFDGTLRPPDDGSFHDLINKFFGWVPVPPSSLSKLIRTIAGPCRMLRSAVAELIEQEVDATGFRPFTRLAENWRNLLFPRLEDKDFPDAYAQTVTFALLLAREVGVDFHDRNLKDIADQLGKHHPLMGRALHVLAHGHAVRKLKILDSLRVIIGAIDWQKLPARDREKYWDLYEPFLNVYDKELRKRSGSYYTPEPVARSMVQFVGKILRERLKIDDEFGGDNVFTLDPAMGTGTFLVEVVRSVAGKCLERHNIRYTRGVLRDIYRERLIGFERSAATYVVSELRLQQTLRDVYGAEIPETSKRYLTNTLDDPDEPYEQGLEYAEIIESREQADVVKRKTPIVAILGNPPYVKSANQADPAPWIEKSRLNEAGDDLSDRPALDDFRARGYGKFEIHLLNTGTYFWRWSTWKVFDTKPARAGVVALITTSAYLTGPAFAGMRRYLRRTCDEGWIIDLSPEGQRSQASTRVFRGVKEPVCIGIFVRRSEASNRTVPAKVLYRALWGSQREKFDVLLRGFGLAGDGWRECQDGWTEDFLPADPPWTQLPKIDDIAPWGVSGVKPGLTWVYAPRPEILVTRWRKFTAASDRVALFKDPELPGRKMPAALAAASDIPSIRECAFRAFDRQYLLADPLLVDRLRSSLWNINSEHQVYASIQHDKPLKHGPGILFTHLVPDQHHFGARGGKVVPLYKHAQAGEWSSNVPTDLLRYLTARLGAEQRISPGEVFAYIAAIAAHPGYTRRFWDSLRRPGVRVPFTCDKELWAEACGVGRRVIWLHTFGARWGNSVESRPKGQPALPPERRPEIIREISDDVGSVPDAMRYDMAVKELHIGDGIIGPVSESAFEYQVCGKRVIGQWFSFRQRTRTYQRRVSALDDERVERWTYHLTRDLVDLISILSLLVELEPQQMAILDAVCDGPQITVNDLERAGILPPTKTACKAPRLARQDELDYD
jgi:hypothetical protein